MSFSRFAHETIDGLSSGEPKVTFVAMMPMIAAIAAIIGMLVLIRLGIRMWARHRAEARKASPFAQAVLDLMDRETPIQYTSTSLRYGVIRVCPRSRYHVWMWIDDSDIDNMEGVRLSWHESRLIVAKAREHMRQLRTEAAGSKLQWCLDKLAAPKTAGETTNHNGSRG